MTAICGHRTGNWLNCSIRPVENIQAARTIIQSCDPTGIGARDLGECLALQLAEIDRLDPGDAEIGGPAAHAGPG